ncbi:putative nicotinate-nucleotide adenylyltransferase [Companilactobacillus crustorum]|uniref:Probable nicotinate-nucleotide adenylyltransferase n=3 Tax=Companilactobacillus TaxID=2767879 RepID=A0A837RGN9_9LACO|nr:nicotinate-nucleotide adenylyltransferase [Companilactobacillus crustorum]HCD08615.1 nicotinate-nucleotide adenylyltransferase [Lactobacillus sp.]KRK40741.1 nicotinic acid mononucleotide adenylyltransferase [Companilactobacillus crustorum JCM 15951]KRO20495.1 nicotinic acid mononucleotide adenylyltransferase [Companilactobacillus crustorum]WDT66260.1 nicotinate-nucleotide adenylyltransferase [Companilactobacillus crustorum]GEO76956.1 putative nicotinate-nucleotide adenylyltransferase [Compa
MYTGESVLTKTKVQPQKLYNANKKHVGILTGPFNPIHYGHLMIAEQVYEQLCLDKILFIPDKVPPHRGVSRYIPKVSVDDRINMIKFGIRDNPHFQLDMTDIDLGGISYTYETIKKLKTRNPNTDYYLIVGYDMIENLSKWSHIDDLVQQVHFVGVCRKGFEKKSQYPILWVNTPEIEISSSEIRKRVREGKPLKYFVPDDVAWYIRDRGIYKKQ